MSHSSGLFSIINRKNAGGGDITFVEAVGSDFGFGRSVTLNHPTAGNNDIWIAVGCTNGTSTFNGTPPTGWTKVTEANGSDESIAAFWYRSSASESATSTWTNILSANDGGGRWVVLSYSGCTTSGSPIDVSAAETSAFGAAKDIAATSATNNAMAIGIVGLDPSGTGQTMTWDGAHTERIDSDTTPSGANGNLALLHVAEELLGTAGAYSIGGDISAAESASEITLALKPA